MMEELKTGPSAKRILSLLVELLADQHSVRVSYSIIKKEEDTERGALAGMRGGAAV